MAFYRGEREGEVEVSPGPRPIAALATGGAHVVTIRRMRQCFLLHTVEVKEQ